MPEMQRNRKAMIQKLKTIPKGTPRGPDKIGTMCVALETGKFYVKTDKGWTDVEDLPKPTWTEETTRKIWRLFFSK